MGSKSSGAAAPDYSSVATADEQAAQLQSDTAAQQLQWAQTQYNQEEPYVQSYLQSQTANSNQQTADAQNLENQYTSVTQPLETQYANQAQNYDSAAQQQTNMNSAEGDVANNFDAQRQSSLSSLESYGIDPSQTRYSALDLGTRVQQAAATAAAGTQSAINTQTTGMGLEANAIAQGENLPSQVSQAYSGSTSSGATGIGTATNTSTAYGNLMGTAPQYYGLANQSDQGAVGALSTGYNNQESSVEENNANTSAGYQQGGALIGGVITAGAIAI